MTKKTGTEKQHAYEAFPLFMGEDGAFYGIVDNFLKTEWQYGRVDNPNHEATYLTIGCFNQGEQLPGDLDAIPLLCPHCGEPYGIPDQVVEQIEFTLQKAQNRNLCWYGIDSRIADLSDLPPYDFDYDGPSQLGLAITAEGIISAANWFTSFHRASRKKRRTKPWLWRLPWTGNMTKNRSTW